MKQKNPFTIIHEDDRLVAVNKVSGIAISPDRWDENKERLDRLVSAFLNLEKIYTVHRIDRDTSGLIVFAKDEETHKVLSEAFENRSIHKRYIAVINGRPSWEETDCDLSLVPNGNKQHHTIVDKFKGKKSLTHFKLLGYAGNYSVVEAIPETGRTHQIRVHLANLGHPVVCDEFYGTAKPVFLSAIKRGWRGDPLDEKPLLARLGLHAAELFIPEYPPGNGEGLKLKAPLPRDMAALINQMEKTAGAAFGEI